MDFQAVAHDVIDIEHAAVERLHRCIDTHFDQACQCLQNCRGRVVVLGMGKSGHIANKIAATFASTGTPALSVHAGEASHGDLGMITRDDVVLAVSFSGNTPEVVNLLPRIERLGVPLISITGNAQSKLAKAATIHLEIYVEKEACPLNLAPTASTTATLVLGDALAIALLTARGFTAADFAFSHPGGQLGKQLLLQVKTLMHQGDRIPTVNPEMPMKEVFIEMTQKRLGMVVVTDPSKHLLGIFTDGDVRRTYQDKRLTDQTPIQALMSKNPKTIHPDDMAAKALTLMEQSLITALVVVDKTRTVQGVLHMHDILQAVLADKEPE